MRKQTFLLILACNFWVQSANAQLKLTVWIKNNCTRCTSELNKIKEAGIPVTVKNVDLSAVAKNEVIKVMGSQEYLKMEYFPILEVVDPSAGYSFHSTGEIAEYAISEYESAQMDVEEEEKVEEAEGPDHHDENKPVNNNTNINSNTQSNTVSSKYPMAKEMVERHNYWRAQLGIGPVNWSDKLADYAQVWANELAKRGCAFEHRPYDGQWKQLYGENLYMISGAGAKPQQVVDNWAEERKSFNFTTLECNGEWYVCGHYTQVIWENTTEIGCAKVKCGSQEIWVCNYNPPGNYTGQKPYKKKN